MTPKALALALAACCLSGPAAAYCIHNELKDKDVVLLQEEHPDYKRHESRLRATVKPGQNTCCEFKNLDCNPNGRTNSLVGLQVSIAGEPPLVCGPVGVPAKSRIVKVHGDGVMRIVANPRQGTKGQESAAPYVVRVWAPDKQDVTGPSGLPCR